MRLWTLPAIGGPKDGQTLTASGKTYPVPVGPLTGVYRRDGAAWQWYGPLPDQCVQEIARQTALQPLAPRRPMP